MKFTSALLFALLFASSVFGADPLNEALQRGLLAEESQRDFKAAATAFEEVVRAADQQREVVATALFRLAEMQRRLGQTNEAAASYRRLAREYGEQTNLVALAWAHLPENTVTSAGVRLIEAQLERASLLLGQTGREQTELADFIGQSRALPTVWEVAWALEARHPSAELKRLRSERNKAEVELAKLSPDFGPAHPEIVRRKAVLAKLDEQISREADGVLRELGDREARLRDQIEAQRRNVRVLEAKLIQERSESPASGAGLTGGNELAEGLGRLRADLRELETTIAQREQYAANSAQSLAALENAQGPYLASQLASSYWRNQRPAELSRLLDLRQAAEREESQLADRFGPENPKRKELEALLAKLDEQLAPWRQRAIEELKWGMDASARSLDELMQRRDALRLRLAEAKQGATSHPVAVGLTEQRRLLMEEIKVAEEQAALLRKRLEVGAAGSSQNEVLQAQRDVLALKRLLAGLTRLDLMDLPGAAPAQEFPEFKSGGSIVVLGQVNRPGVVQLPRNRGMDLVEAIAASGNFSKMGNRNRIQLRRGTNLFRLKFDEVMTNRFELKPGDAVEVMEKVF